MLTNDATEAMAHAKHLAQLRGRTCFIYHAPKGLMRISLQRRDQRVIAKIEPPIKTFKTYGKITAEDAKLIYQLYQSDEPKRARRDALTKRIKALMKKAEQLKKEKSSIKILSSADIAEKFDVSEPSVRRAIAKMKGKK